MITGSPSRRTHGSKFRSLAFNRDDLEIYRNRLKRYSMRHFQNEALYPRLKKFGLKALPERIEKIYSPRALARMQPRLSLENYLVDRRTIRELRDNGSMRGRAFVSEQH